MTRKWEIVDDGDRDFAGVYDVWIECPDEDRMSGTIIGACYRENAPLIAAAPDLLDAANIALGALTGNMDGDWIGQDPVATLRAAIAKATRHVPD